VRFDLLKILLVDDNQHMRLLLTEILRALGVRRIYEALDGAEALQMMRQIEMDLVMTDLTMGPLDGIDFVNLLRNSPDSPGPFTPVIMITGHSTMRRVAEARDAGVNEFVAKPLTAKALIDRMKSVINSERGWVKSANYIGPDRRRKSPPDYPGPFRRAADKVKGKG